MKRPRFLIILIVTVALALGSMAESPATAAAARSIDRASTALQGQIRQEIRSIETLLGNRPGVGLQRPSAVPDRRIDRYQDRLRALEHLAARLGRELDGQGLIAELVSLRADLKRLQRMVTADIARSRSLERPRAAPRPRISAPSATGAISGTVTDSGSGVPLDASVDVYDSNGDWVGYSDTDATGAYLIPDLGAGTYFAMAYASGYVAELYDDLRCVYWCDPTTGTPISVTAGSTTGGIDFALDLGGWIAGTVTDASTGLPIADFGITIYDDNGDWVGGYARGWSGDYSIDGLPAGTYFATTYNWSGYLDELYDDLPCHFGCDVTGGTPIEVSAGSTTSGIDFALELGGSITGTITDADTATPLEDIEVDIFNADGDYITYGWTDASGHYSSASGLATGSYFARTWNRSQYLNELYDDLPCVAWCDPTNGTPIPVNEGLETSAIDFALELGGSIAGTITDADSGAPISSLYVDIYDINGGYVTYGWADGSGEYLTRQGLTTGTYFARTWVWASDHMDELYDDYPCLGWWCDPTRGTPIAVTQGSRRSGIDFALGIPLLRHTFDDDLMPADWSFQRGSWEAIWGWLHGVPDDLVGTQIKARAIADPAFGGCTICTQGARIETSDLISGTSPAKVYARLLGWYADKKTNFSVTLKPVQNKVVVRQKENKNVLVRDNISLPLDVNVAYTVMVKFDGAAFDVYLDGVWIHRQLSRFTASPSGTIGVQSRDSDVWIDEAVCLP